MKNLFSLKILIIVVFLLSAASSFSQSKKERKQKTVGLETGMYNSTESKEALAFYSEAEDKARTKDYKGAIKLYKKAIKEDPKFVEAYDNTGVCYRKLGDLKNAIAYYEKSIELYPNGSMAHMNLGVVYGIQKEYDKAIAEYEIIQKIDPEDPEGYYGTINLYLMKRDYKSAIKNATKTLEIYEATDSRHLSEAQYLLGISYYYDKDDAKAKIYIEQAKKNGINVNKQVLQELGIE